VPFDERYRRIVSVLKAGREVEYGFLGVSLDLMPEEGEVRLGGVTRGSPAARAGLGKGDVILRVGDTRIRSNDDLFLAVGAALAGSVVEMEVQSQGFARRVKVRLSKYFFPDPQPVIASNRPAPARGLRVEYTSLLLQVPGEKRSEMAPGVLVKEVATGSPAERAGLAPWRDVVTHVNGREVNTPDEFYQAARAAGPLELRLFDRPPVTVP
jgi:S1-C subfamily serine protease